MHAFLDRWAGPTALIVLALFASASAGAAEPAALSLAEAQRLAVLRDAGRLAIESESGALREMSVAAGQLPDPEARIGAVNVPTDSFDLGAEDMTMLEVGIMQRFPAGDSRRLQRAGLDHRAQAADAEAGERARSVALAVERAWRELDYQDQSLALLGEQLRWGHALVESIEASYRSGEGSQTELLDARLMLLDIEERAIDARREQDVAQAELERWIGPGRAMNRVAAPLRVADLPPLGALVERIASHPRLEQRAQQRLAAQAAADLARERYKPSFGVDVSYGFRQGAGMAGGTRPDMLTAMLTFDVPLFTRDRQDRDAAAARAMLRVADAGVDDESRELEGRLRAEHARATRLAELIALYQQQVERLADVSHESTLSAYGAGDAPLEEVISTQQRVLAVRDRVLRLRADYAISRAELDYLAGEAP